MGGKTILVVEDDADIGMMIVHQLKKAGYEPQLAAEGIQAMQLLRANPPAVVVLDFMFPAGGGASFHERVRSSSMTSAVPIVILTSTPPEIVLQSLKTDAATYYVGKPYKGEALIGLLADILAGKAEPLH